MGTIRIREASSGKLRYRAEIRINRHGYPLFNESKTFNTSRLAENWIVKREAEIDKNPEILRGKSDLSNLKLHSAIERYISEVGGTYSKSKMATLKLVKKLPLAKIELLSIRSSDLSDHVALRRDGVTKLGLGPVAPSTIQTELLQVRSVLVHASIMWDLDVDLIAFDKTTAQLRKTRQISASKKRTRVPINIEIKKLLNYFSRKWQVRQKTRYPMHLIMLFAIFSCRREAEITRLDMNDYDKALQTWRVRDLKNPRGSRGNDKDFSVSDDCGRIIKILMQPDIRYRMLKSMGNKDFLIPLRPQTISAEFHFACKELGIDDLRFHDLRHDGCTRLAEKGLSIPQIQQVSLHDSWQTLQRYVSVKKRAKPLSLNEMLKIIDEE